jgi:hypothetical protein
MRLRLLLLPFAALAEAILLATCGTVSVISPARALRIANWATRRLPNLRWYLR